MTPKLIDLSEFLSDVRDGFTFYATALTDPQIVSKQLIFRIDADGLDHRCLTAAEAMSCADSQTIKIEGLENDPELYEIARKICHKHITVDERKITIHLFYAIKNAPSFPTHTDPVDVVVLCLSGVKEMEADSKFFSIEAGQGLFMPANLPHRAINGHDSIMLSLGFEKIDK